MKISEAQRKQHTIANSKSVVFSKNALQIINNPKSSDIFSQIYGNLSTQSKEFLTDKKDDNKKINRFLRDDSTQKQHENIMQNKWQEDKPQNEEVQNVQYIDNKSNHPFAKSTIPFKITLEDLIKKSPEQLLGFENNNKNKMTEMIQQQIQEDLQKEEQKQLQQEQILRERLLQKISEEAEHPRKKFSFLNRSATNSQTRISSFSYRLKNQANPNFSEDKKTPVMQEMDLRVPFFDDVIESVNNEKENAEINSKDQKEIVESNKNEELLLKDPFQFDKNEEPEILLTAESTYQPQNSVQRPYSEQVTTNKLSYDPSQVWNFQNIVKIQNPQQNNNLPYNNQFFRSSVFRQESSSQSQNQFATISDRKKSNLKNPFKYREQKKIVRFDDYAKVRFEDGKDGSQQITDNYKVKKLNLQFKNNLERYWNF